MLKLIFEFKGEEVTGEWRKLHSEQIHNLYFSPFVIKVIRSRRLMKVGPVTRTKEIINVRKIFVGNPKGKESH